MIVEETMRTVCGYIGAGLMCICVVLWGIWIAVMYWRYWRHKVER